MEKVSNNLIFNVFFIWGAPSIGNDYIKLPRQFRTILVYIYSIICSNFKHYFLYYVIIIILFNFHQQYLMTIANSGIVEGYWHYYIIFLSEFI